MTRDKVGAVLLIPLFIFLSGFTVESMVRAQDSNSSQEPDREYRLEAKITGYTGIGGQIAGVRNPVLRAEHGEVVRITIVNGEILAHDLVLEQLNIRIVDEETGEVPEIAYISQISGRILLLMIFEIMQELPPIS